MLVKLLTACRLLKKYHKITNSVAVSTESYRDSLGQKSNLIFEITLISTPVNSYPRAIFVRAPTAFPQLILEHQVASVAYGIMQFQKITVCIPNHLLSDYNNKNYKTLSLI